MRSDTTPQERINLFISASIDWAEAMGMSLDEFATACSSLYASIAALVGTKTDAYFPTLAERMATIAEKGLERAEELGLEVVDGGAE